MKTKNTILILLALVLSSVMVDAQNSGGFAPEGLYLDKKVIEDPSKPNSYEIQLETFVTGIKSSKTDPVDIVLVLDASGSMHQDTKMYNGRYRIDYLHDAANAFVDQLYDLNSTGIYRIAIVRFSSNDDTHSKTLLNLTQLTSSTKATIKSTISGIEADGSTYMSRGLKEAYNILNNDTSKSRQKYVIVLTDGLPVGDTPGSQSTGIQSDYEEIDKCVDWAYQLKNNLSASNASLNTKVYSIGLCIAASDKIVKNSSYYEVTIGDYLNRVSSNYLNVRYLKNKADTKPKWKNTSNATSDPDPGTVNPDGVEYTVFASTPDQLTGIFSQMGETIGQASIDLGGSSTTIVDIVTESFKIPDEFKLAGGAMDPSCVTVYAKECTNMRSLDNEGAYEYLFEGDPIYRTGDNLLKDVVVSTPNSQEVRVSGFDFSAYFVMGDPEKHEYQGYKLVITFPIVINPDNPGGATTATNTAESGVYFDSDGDGIADTQIGGFEIPSVKIPNIVVMKSGLHKGESAIFNVYKLTENNGVITRDLFPTVLVATQKDDSGVAFARMKIQKPGRYEIEETSWSWAYNITECEDTYAKDDSESITQTQWNEKGFGTPEEVAAHKYLVAIPFAFGTETTANSIIRNVNDFTEDFVYGYKGTFFIFTNEEKSNNPPHAEANKNNEFYKCN